MISLTELWLPILLSAVFVFVASSIFHMVLPIHKNDCKKLAGEETVLEAMRNQGVVPGSYAFPCPESMKEMGSPEMTERYNRGPVGFITVMPNGPPAIGKSLIQWFLFSLVVGVFVAYVGAVAISTGASFAAVFRVTTTVAILGYAATSVPESIWKGQSWGVTLKFIFDGIVYGLVTGATFGWLWPAAV